MLLDFSRLTGIADGFIISNIKSDVFMSRAFRIFCPNDYGSEEYVRRIIHFIPSALQHVLYGCINSGMIFLRIIK